MGLSFNVKGGFSLLIEIRNDSILLNGYVNAIVRDSRPMLDDNGEKFVEQISPKTFQRALENGFHDRICSADPFLPLCRQNLSYLFIPM